MPLPEATTPPPPQQRRKVSLHHSRVKGSGAGYLSKLPPIAFRLRPDERRAFEAEADRRGTTLAELARSFVTEKMGELARSRAGAAADLAAAEDEHEG